MESCPKALSDAPMIPLAWSPFGRLANRRANLRRRLSSCTVAGLSPDSKLRAPLLVVRKAAPRVSLASWLITFWTSFCLPMEPWVSLPFHQSSAPNRAAAWTQAAWILRQFSGESPTCPASRLSLVWAFLAFFTRTSWCSFSVSCESSQTPSHWVAWSLKWTALPATRMPVGELLGQGGNPSVEAVKVLTHIYSCHDQEWSNTL